MPSGPLFACCRGSTCSEGSGSCRWCRPHATGCEAGRQLDHGPARTLVVAGPDLRGATHESRAASLRSTAVPGALRPRGDRRSLPPRGGDGWTGPRGGPRSVPQPEPAVLTSCCWPTARSRPTTSTASAARREIVVLSACSSARSAPAGRRGAARSLHRAPVRRVRRTRRHDAPGPDARHRPVARRPAPRAGRRAIARRGRAAQRDGSRLGHPDRPAAGLRAVPASVGPTSPTRRIAQHEPWRDHELLSRLGADRQPGGLGREHR